MFDKSIPLFNVIMKRSAGSPPLIDLLPNGFSILRFAEGKEQRWAEIKHGEFSYIRRCTYLHSTRIYALFG